jgi:hypothetical protein
VNFLRQLINSTKAGVTFAGEEFLTFSFMQGIMAEWHEDKECARLFFAPKGHENLAQGSTLGTVSPLRRALKGLQIECVSTRQTYVDLSPLQGESPYLMVPRVETLG